MKSIKQFGLYRQPGLNRYGMFDEGVVVISDYPRVDPSYGMELYNLYNSLVSLIEDTGRVYRMEPPKSAARAKRIHDLMLWNEIMYIKASLLAPLSGNYASSKRLMMLLRYMCLDGKRIFRGFKKIKSRSSSESPVCLVGYVLLDQRILDDCIAKVI